MEKNNQEKIIHDINNLLTSVGLSVELLLQELYGPLTARQKKCLKSLLADGKKIQKLIKKIK